MSKKNMELYGLKEVYGILDGLPLQMKAATLRSVHRSALTKVMKSGTPDVYGAKEFTKVSADPREKTGVLFGILSSAYWFRFIEYGTTIRKRKSGGSTGKMTAKPFFRRYVDSRMNKLINFVNKEYGELASKFISRKTKRMRR